MSAPLARIEIRLPQELKDQITALATERGASVSEIGLAALQDLLERETRPETALCGGVDKVHALLEAFVRVYCTLTPEIPEVQREAAARRGHKRWERIQVLLSQEKGDA